MPVPPIVPKGDALRRAVAWLSEQGNWTPSLIEQACQRFDVAPADEEFLHHVIAGSTLLLKPSKSEASGQYQRVALAYGTIPVVRTTGGIAEGLVDADDKDGGNAFLFKKFDAADLTKALNRALAAHAAHERWSGIVANAMATPVGWARRVGHAVAHPQRGHWLRAGVDGVRGVTAVCRDPRHRDSPADRPTAPRAAVGYLTLHFLHPSSVPVT